MHHVAQSWIQTRSKFSAPPICNVKPIEEKTVVGKSNGTVYGEASEQPRTHFPEVLSGRSLDVVRKYNMCHKSHDKPSQVWGFVEEPQSLDLHRKAAADNKVYRKSSEFVF